MAKTDWLMNERGKNLIVFPALVIRKYKNGDVVRNGITKTKEPRQYASFMAQEYSGPTRRFTGFGDIGEKIIKENLTPGCVCMIDATENAELRINADGEPDGYEYRYEVLRIQVIRRTDDSDQEQECSKNESKKKAEQKATEEPERSQIDSIPSGITISADMFLKTPLGRGKVFG